ncbi:Ribosomal RNA large subunit methyltransferase N [Lachnospiraceae bacterium TWA4]|nr:Ribosomal RNA large subunit methyltransferase N [Lachnospiraceae bacterium TWA4]
MNNEQKELRSMSLEELQQVMVLAGEKPFRAKQVFEWLHKKQVSSIEEMTNLSKKLRTYLKENYTVDTLKVAKELISSIDGTRKYLFKLSDGNIIESVWMNYKHGNSVCISSQVGCRMGCKFCASTLGGLVRNLRPSEMLEQIYRIKEATGQRVDSIVIMGSGEPLDNYDSVVRFLRLITDENGENLSRRAITLSTCGIVPRIYDLAKENLPITLALSLHATTNEERIELMPIARKYSLDEVLEACEYYFKQTGRRISFEYSLVKDVNNSKEHAKRLSELISKTNSHVNLIPVNPVKERSFETVTRKQAEDFQKMLEKNGVNATIRREMGRDISGACGQLRRSFIEKN